MSRSLSRGGLCPSGVSIWEGSLSGGSLSRAGSLSRGSLSMGGGGLCPGGGLSLSGGSLSWRPPYSNKRTIRILLECILVFFFFWVHDS